MTIKGTVVFAFLPDEQIVRLASQSLNKGISFSSFLLQYRLDSCPFFDERCTLISIDTGCPFSSAFLKCAASLDLLSCSFPSVVLLLKKNFSS